MKRFSIILSAIILPLVALCQTTPEEVFADLNKAGGV